MRALIGVELPGYRPVDVDTWANDDGDVLSVHFFELPPDLPAGLDDGPTLRHTLTHYTAQAGGGLIEASVKTLGGLPRCVRYSSCRCPAGRTGKRSSVVSPCRAPGAAPW